MRNLQSYPPGSGAASPRIITSPPLSVSMDANDRHLISQSFLTTSSWILSVHTLLSLPPLRPCLAAHFRQGWDCECTLRLATSDLGFANPRIIPTYPASRAAVRFVLPSTTSKLVPGLPYPRLLFLHQNANVNFLANMHCPRVPRSSAALLSSCRPHSKLPSPSNTSSAAPTWF